MSFNTEIPVLQSTKEDTTISGWTAFCLFKAQRYDELLQISAISPQVVYYQVLAMLFQGDDENAWQLLQKNTNAHLENKPRVLLETHMLNKKILKRYLDDGQQNASDLLQELSKINQDDLWQFSNRVDLWLAFSYQYLGDREKSQSIFERFAQHQPFNYNLAHAWAIFAYTWAFDLLDKAETDQALEQLEIVIANFAYILVNEPFWQDWIDVRQQVYQISIDNGNITDLKAQVESHINEILTQKLNRQNSENATEISRRWEIAWEQELEAARSLKRMGRFTGTISGREVEVGFGPLFIKHRKLEKEVKDFLKTVSRPPARRMQESLRTLLEAELEQEDFNEIFESQDPKKVARLKRLFSELGICEVLIGIGQWQEALHLLENNQFDAVGKLNLLDDQEFNALRSEMITQVQLQIAENIVREREADLATVATYWNAALQSSHRWNGSDATKRQIIQTALGRVQVLQRRQIDRAIKLLEYAHDLLPDGQITGKLAELLRIRAVPKANQAIKDENYEDLELCIPDFRRSLRLSPSVKQTRFDLCQVLNVYARWYYERGDNGKAAEFLQEITRNTREGLSIHKGDERLSQFLGDAQGGLQMLQRTRPAQEPTTQDLFEGFLQLLEDVASEQSQTAAEYNRSGVNRTQQSDYLGAIGDFVQALEIDPHFRQARINLKRTVNLYINHLLMQGEIGRAFEVMAEFKQHFPYL